MRHFFANTREEIFEHLRVQTAEGLGREEVEPNRNDPDLLDPTCRRDTGKQTLLVLLVGRETG